MTPFEQLKAKWRRVDLWDTRLDDVGRVICKAAHTSDARLRQVLNELRDEVLSPEGHHG